MVRLAGGGLVWLGCVLCGLCAAGGLRSRVNLLEEIVQALGLLERELTLNHTPLPELLEQLACRTSGQGSRLFRDCYSSFEKGNSFTYAWNTSLRKVWLKEEERALLHCLPDILGRYDALGQAQTLARFRREVEGCAARSREELCSMSRVYGALGMTAGGFLALMLL